MNDGKNDDQNGELEEKAQDPAIAEGEFTETVIPRPRPFVQEDTDEPAIAAEFVEPPPPIGRRETATDDEEDDIDDELRSAIASIPKGTDVTIVVKRKADRGERFRLPYTNRLGHVDNVPWDRRPFEEVYSEVQRIHGGGRYNFQFQYNGQLQKGAWNFTIFDPPFQSEAEKMLAKQSEPERMPDPSPTFAQQQPAAPVAPQLTEDQIIEKGLERMVRMKELFDSLSPQPAAAVAETIPIKDQIALAMMRNAGEDPDLSAQVIKKILGLGGGEEKKGFVDIGWYAVTHAGEIATAATAIAGVAGQFLPLLIGRRDPPPPNAAMRVLPAMTIGHQTVQEAQPAPTPGLVMPPAADMAAAGVEEVPAAPVAPSEAVQDVVW